MQKSKIKLKVKNLISKTFNFRLLTSNLESGQSLIELLIAIAIAAILLPALLTGFVTSREGKVGDNKRIQAATVLKETEEATRSIREKGWPTFATNGTFHPIISSSSWSLASGADTTNGFTRQLVISDVLRNSSGVIVASGGTVDPSTKKVTITVSWTSPVADSVTSSLYLTRYLDNLSYIHTTKAEFDTGTKTQTQTTSTSGGEVILGDNTKAKWCSPSFASTTIDLPDGPPVAVAASASAATSSPNDVFVATSPYSTSSAKLAYVTVAANVDPPVSTLKGTFTLDASKYSNPSYVPSGINLTNSFKTNDVKLYKATSGKTYALLATNLPDHEVIAILVNDNNASNDSTSTGEYADPVNKIYKYWTFFNTRRYQGNNTSTPNQDESPFGYGATSLTILENRGYAASGGYLYVFDLSNIDSKSTSSGLDMVGCRIELDGYECQAGNGTDKKYSSGQTGTSWGDTTAPAHPDTCADGGNIELYATNDLYPVKVGSSIYIYAAVGAGTNPEFNIVNATSVPTGSTSPTISNNSCGRASGGNSSWKKVGSYDFNTAPGTEEASNSVFAKADGTRAYISSNGGASSKQFYILNTTTKTAPTFLSGSNNGTGPATGYYSGSGANGELYPRRSLTVLNGQRVVLVGKDGTVNSNDAQEYQVLDSATETTPNYCGGLNYDIGFNDLTSVTEADLDNFVYMVANTDVNELKIIQGGPDGRYSDTGTIESATFDAGYNTAFNRFSVTSTIPASTNIKYQFAVADAVSGSCTGVAFSYAGPDGTSGTYYTTTSAALALDDNGSGYENPGRCFRYKAFFDTTDFDTTPTLEDITVNYSP